MYLDFYKLKTFPFNVTSDSNFFFESSSHKEAINILLYGINERKGIILITGEVGSGKTTLCKALLNRLPKDTKTSVIFNPYFSDIQLLKAIVEDFGIQVEKKNRLDIIKKLNEFLLDINQRGLNAVLIIDEAQNLKPNQLEQIRLLSNLETTNYKLLQIVLVGQPELLEKLKQFNLRQIYQRIFVKYNLMPLKEEELESYIKFRLEKAGSSDIKILPESYRLIYEFSSGIPRLINMLCDRALLCGFVREKKIFDSEILKACIEELR